ncbi:lipocalin family protein [Pontibacter silvestris]|uniref:Lipocalin family protein n=1 Tax=Pontibacter silvestris TaxID=2305183 RepID=A0ABW4X5H7_9BACT|nr:lipocalin family protein [Pontibacter silvestris]MCC9137079.1 lipocalin family protein [Pontibacter silvestris]
MNEAINKMEVSVKLWMHSWSTLTAILLAIVLISCGDSNEVGSESMLTGPSNKTWRAEKETNAVGNKEKLTDAEKQETMQFYADGRFALGGGGTLQTGTWSFDQAARRLTLQLEDQDVTLNFEVLKLTNDEMRLKAADGSEMLLQAD